MGQKKNFDLKKNIKKILVKKNFGSEKKFWSKKFWIQNKFVQEQFGLQKL